MLFEYLVHPDKELNQFFVEEIKSIIGRHPVEFRPRKEPHDGLLIKSRIELSSLMVRLASARKAHLLVHDVTQIYELLSKGFCSRIGYYIPYTIKFIGFHRDQSEAEEILREITRMHPMIRVSLSAPQIELEFLPEGIGVRLPVGRDVVISRDTKYRPYAPPATMSSLLSRVLVNLTRLSAGQIFLDPFCGTGSLVLEAVDMGLRAICVDINPKVLEAAEMLLSGYYGFKEVELRVGDSRHLPFEDESIDGIATDPPYGISSSTYGATLMGLYRDFLVEAHRVLKRDSRLVVCHTPSVPVEKLAAEIGFDYELKFSMRVHSRLVRLISILRAK